MARDTYDAFEPRERGRFGDNESVRSNADVKSNLCDLDLILRQDRPLSIMVSRTDANGEKWVALPKSQIEFEYTNKAKGQVRVTLPEWLATRVKLI